jgi:transcriptional regulator with XRE-family HTH domain
MKREESQNLKIKFFELRGIKGLSYDSISQEIGVSKPTLLKWERDYKMLLGDISALEHQNILSIYDYCSKKRLEILVKLAKSIEEEFEKRDLSSIPTHKLIDSIIAIQAKIEKVEELKQVQGGVFKSLENDYEYFTET